MNYEDRYCSICKVKTIHLVLTGKVVRVFLCLRHQADFILVGIGKEKEKAFKKKEGV